MGEQRAGRRRRYGVPACPAARDSVDRLLLDWERERPDLDFTPVGVVTRLARVRGHLDTAVAAVFARYGLSAADFQVVVTLRRAGEPFTLPQARLMEALGLTSGTVSVRLDRLERHGIVVRAPDAADARVSRVTLTPKGLELFDAVAPAHLAGEDRLLSALDDTERAQLADLLRRLLADLESPVADLGAELGLVLEPAHLARARRAEVGLSDACGLLVREVDPQGPAGAAGIERGDLVTSLDRVPVRSSIGLAEQLDVLVDRRSVTVGLRRGDTDLRVRLRPAVRSAVPS